MPIVGREGALTRAKSGAEYGRVYPGGTLQSNFNVMYRVAARLKDPLAWTPSLFDGDATL